MRAALAIFALVIAAAISYWMFFYPPHLLKNATQSSLENFAETVTTKDRAAIGSKLGELLADTLQLHLEVNFLTIGHEIPPMVQDFDKASFITFIDNTLYSLTDYGYEPRLQEFKLSDDRKTAEISWTSKEWGDGSNYYGGNSVQMRFSSDTSCQGTVMFEGKVVRLAKTTCSMQFRSVPKPGEMDKLRNLDAVKDLLLRQ